MAAGMRGGLGLVSCIFLAGALVLMFFVILAGVTTSTPLGMIYFLRADTSMISGATNPISQWTYFYICGDGNTNCGSAYAAPPFGYAWTSAATGVPSSIVGNFAGTSSYYYYIWRFGWVFYLIGLAFGVFAVFSGLLACTRVGSGLSGLLVMTSCFFTTIAAILMTVEFVKARDAFNANGMTATIGSYAFGFTWAAVVALFISATLFFGGCFVGREKKNNDGVRDEKRGGFGFGRNRTERPRGSFIDDEGESQRRVVKEEY